MRVVEVPWAQTRGLRQRVLGWTAESVPGDENGDTVHLAAEDSRGRARGVVSACPHPCPERPGAIATYFWAMAVADEYQHQGVGSQLIAELVDRCTADACAVLWGDAREAAVGFYLACGATLVGGPYRDTVTGLQDRRVVFDLDRPYRTGIRRSL
jgi:GNAT superfamily N-acetyltransferase